MYKRQERDQLPAPCWAHEEGPERRSTSVAKPPPDRVPPHLESFLAQLAVPVKCAIWSFSSNLPSWSRSVWCPAFLRHAFTVLCCAPCSIRHASPGVSSILLPLRHAVMSSLCGPLVGSSSPRGGTRVPFYRVGDVVLRTNHPRGGPFLHPRVEVASPIHRSVTGLPVGTWRTLNY